jgi:2-methylcitrate dehydratase PrpD
MGALLAEQDFVANKEFLTTPDGGLYNTYADGGLPDLATGDLGTRWELQQIAMRLWPSATALQEVLTALYNVVESDPVPFESIESVTLSLSETPFKMHGGYSTYKAKFEALLSAHYVAAVYLRDSALTLAQFEPACYDDPALRAFAANQVTVVHDASLKGGQCVAEILTKSGQTVSARCDFPLGAPENPVTAQQIEDKFRTYAGSVLPAENIDRIVDMIDKLETLGSARDLVDLLRKS